MGHWPAAGDATFPRCARQSGRRSSRPGQLANLLRPFAARAARRKRMLRLPRALEAGRLLGGRAKNFVRADTSQPFALKLPARDKCWQIVIRASTLFAHVIIV